MSFVSAVLDTNVVYASFSPHESSPNREIIKLWRQGKFRFLYSRDTLAEYIEKLRYFGIEKETIIEFVSVLLKEGQHVPILFYHFKNYPQDPDDVAFLLCALNGGATHIVSYDKHLLDINHLYEITICKPIPFLQELRKNI